jgi:hypothetical protein
LSRVSVAFEPYPESEAVWRYLAERFGLTKDTFAAHRLWHRPGVTSIWIAHAACRPASVLRVQGLGLMAFRRPPPRGYPTSTFLRRFGAGAERNVYDVSWEAALQLMHERTLAVRDLDSHSGPWVVRCGQTVIGRGWVRESVLRLDAPKTWRHQLLSL